jgi:hypothetical protein
MDRRSSIVDRRSSIVHRPSSIVHRPASGANRRSRISNRTSAIGIFCALSVLCAGSAAAQDRFRISVNAGQQTTTTAVTQEQTFDRYFEQGSYTFERTIPKAVFYDIGGLVRVWRGLHAGIAVSIFDKAGPGDITASVPHPLQFNKPRTTSAEIAGVERREVGQHIIVGWVIPASAGIDFTVFGGPSIFTTEQTFATGLMLTLDKEKFPFDQLEFPGAQTEIQREHVTGYNAGVDMTWRFVEHVGVGVVLRYAAGRKNFTPTGGSTVEVEVGGLHAGAGVRVGF